MPNTYKPAAVRFLAAVVEKHCKAHGIISEADRDTVAEQALALYNRGVTDKEQLLAALAERTRSGSS